MRKIVSTRRSCCYKDGAAEWCPPVPLWSWPLCPFAWVWFPSAVQPATGHTYVVAEPAFVSGVGFVTAGSVTGLVVVVVDFVTALAVFAADFVADLLYVATTGFETDLAACFTFDPLAMTVAGTARMESAAKPAISFVFMFFIVITSKFFIFRTGRARTSGPAVYFPVSKMQSNRKMWRSYEDVKKIKEETYFPEYIEKLKKTAGLTVNYELLKEPEPSKEDLKKGYGLLADETLFTIHGKKYALGDFYQELWELPDAYQKTFSDYEKKKLLVDQMIVQELLLEENADKTGTGTDGHNLEELKIQYLSQILHKEEVDQKIPDPTEKELSEYYKENLDSFVTPKRAKVSLIWIPRTDDGKGSRQAKEALDAVRAGASFAETAKQFSQDRTAKDGGTVGGWLYAGHLPKELEQTIFSLDAGDVSEVVESAGGYYN